VSDHTHTTIVPGCYRCELGREEELSAVVAERDELRAFAERIIEGMPEPAAREWRSLLDNI